MPFTSGSGEKGWTEINHMATSTDQLLIGPVCHASCQEINTNCVEDKGLAKSLH